MKLAFYKAKKGNWLDKTINLWTGNYGYSHVELIFDNVKTTNADVSLCFSASPREGNVRFKYIELDDKWVVMDFDISDKEEKILYAKSLKYNHAKYDYLGIFFWFVLPIKKQFENKWWCSEIISYLLGVKNFRICPNSMAKLYGVNKQ